MDLKKSLSNTRAFLTIQDPNSIDRLDVGQKMSNFYLTSKRKTVILPTSLEVRMIQTLLNLLLFLSISLVVMLTALAYFFAIKTILEEVFDFWRS